MVFEPIGKPHKSPDEIIIKIGLLFLLLILFDNITSEINKKGRSNGTILLYQSIRP